MQYMEEPFHRETDGREIDKMARVLCAAVCH